MGTSAVIPPPPAGFDFDAPPPVKASAATIPPPPAGFDFDAPPVVTKPMPTGPRERFGPPATLQGGTNDDGYSERRPYYYPDPWAFGETEPLPGPPTPPKMEAFGPPRIPTRTEMEASATGVPKPTVPMETVWNPNTNPAALRLKREQDANSGQSARDFGNQVVQGAQQLAPPIRKALVHSADAELSGATGTVNPLGPLPPITEADSRQAASGANKLLGAGLDVATLALPEAILAKPAAALMGFARFMAVKTFIEEGLKHEGVPKEYAELAGTVGGIAGGATKLREILDRKIAQHNATAADLVAIDHLEGLDKTLWQMAEDSAKQDRTAREAAETGQRGAPNQTASPAPAPPPEPPVRHPLQDLADEVMNPPAEPTEAATVPNIKAFQKAHQAWQKSVQEYQKRAHEWESARVDAATNYMEENPGVSYDDARAATANAAGPEPVQPQGAQPHPDQFHVPAPPPEPVNIEPPKPAKVGKVSEQTPNAPTAFTQTEPESPETMALQVQQAQTGTRRVVMFPKGTPVDYASLGGLAVTNDGMGNIYAYRKDLIDAGQIKTAAKNNTLPEILGHAEVGMGAPDKTALQGEPIAVAGHAPDGTEAQTTVTDAEHLPATIDATQAVTPPGGTVHVGTPQEALDARTGAPAVSDDIYNQAVALVRALGKASTSSLQRQLKLGYGAASAVLDRMHAEGIIGPANGATPREVLPAKKEVIPPSTPEPQTSAPAALGNVAPVDKKPPRSYGYEIKRDGQWHQGYERFASKNEAASQSERAFEAADKAESRGYRTFPSQDEPTHVREGGVTRSLASIESPVRHDLETALADATSRAERLTKEAAEARTETGKRVLEKQAKLWADKAEALRSELANAFGKGGLDTGAINRLSDDGVLSVDEHGNLAIDESKVPAETTSPALGTVAPVDQTAAEPVTRSWKPQQQVMGEGGKWHDNNLRFPTEAEAAAHAGDLHSRWTMSIAHRAVPSEDAPNYRYTGGHLTPYKPDEPVAAQPEQPVPAAAVSLPIIVNGKGTFDAKEKLKALGGRWNKVDKTWELPNTADVQNALAKIPDLNVSVPPAPPEPKVPMAIVHEITPEMVADPQAMKRMMFTGNDTPNAGDTIEYKGKEFKVLAANAFTSQSIAAGSQPSHFVTTYVVQAPEGTREVTPQGLIDLLKGNKDAGTPAAAADDGLTQTQHDAFPPAINDTTTDEPGQIRLANAALRILQQREFIGNNVAFQKIADAAFGGSRAGGKYEMKEAYDALEAAVNRYIADNIGANLLLGDPFYGLEQLRKLLSSLPTQNIRSEQQELLQQFSTPPTLAFFVAKMANINATDVVLEPSAGTGGLLAWAKAAGAIIHGNEIDPKRAELMAYAVRGSNPTPFNAEHIHALLPKEVKPTVVVMNPPFSSTGGRVAHNQNKYGYAHIISALKRLQPGGRLVAILGEGARPEAPTAQDFWKQIQGTGSTIRANIGIEGGEYQKYGTGFGNRVIVVDKVLPTDLAKQTGHPVTALTGAYNNIEEAYRAVSSIIGERPHPAAATRGPVAPTGADLQPGAGGRSAVSGNGGDAIGTPGPRPNNSPSRGQPGRNDAEVQGSKPGSELAGQQPAPTGGGTADNGRPGLIAGAGFSIKDLAKSTAGKLRSRDGRPKLQIEESKRDSHAQNIEDLVLLGTERLLAGNRNLDDWAKSMVADFSDLIQDVAGTAKMDTPDVLSQIYEVATQAAADYESTKDQSPDEDSAIEPLRDEDRTALQARQESELLDRKDDDGSYVQYVPSIEGLAHPGQLVETKVMASVNPPPITYRPNLPWDVIAGAPKPLSAAQVEAVARAGMAHESFNDDGERMALLLGDGTGVGKGQQIAAIIWDNNRQGRRKAIWLTASAGLHKDAKRDFLGIGADELAEQLHSINNWSPDAKIDLKDGVLFSTYSTFVMSSKVKKGDDANPLAPQAAPRRRLDQIMEWLGKDGVIIFDEAQKGKNAVSITASKAGQYMVEIQNALPEARVVYASATAATTVQNTAYMTRLGLWGKGTAFHQGFGHFLNEISSGGVAAMELVAREAKALGRYVSRSISYRGVTFEMNQHEMTGEQRAMYDKAAQAWQFVEQAMMAQLKENNAPRSTWGAGAYYAAQQRFFRNLLTAIKVPTVLDLTDKALANGESVIISFIGTGEAQAKRAVGNLVNGDEDLDFSPKDILIDQIRSNYPTTLYEDYTDPITGKTAKRPVTGPDGNPLENPDAVEKRNQMIEDLNRELALPENPIDFIIKQYGREMVAELTGRGKVLERNAAGAWEAVKRVPDDVAMSQKNAYEEQQFQNGKKRVALISKASGAGFSLHADRSAQNQQHRVHIVMELSWSADDQMQSFGRSHRSNQASAPEYRIVFTDAGGESRFAATIASRLESLGALTKGQRNAGGATSVLAKYNFETQQGQQAVQAFFNYLLKDPEIEGVPYKGVEVIRKMGLLRQQYDDDGNPIGPPSVRPQDLDNVRRFGNRILLMEMGEKPRRDQNAIFDLFANTFEEFVQRAIENGTLDTGVKTVRGDHIRIVKSKVIAKDEATGAETYRYVIEAERKNRIVPVEAVQKMDESATGKMMRRREFKGAAEPDQLIWAIKSTTPITDRSGTVQSAYNFMRPATDDPSKFEKIAATDLTANWEPIETEALIHQISKSDRAVRDTEKYLAAEKEKALAGGYNSVEFYEKEVARLKADRKEKLHQQRDAKEKQFDLWQEAVDAAPKTRIERIDMIGGSMLRIWSRLRGNGGRLDIQMAYPESGGSVVGVAMSEGDADNVESELTGRQIVRTPASVFDAVLRGKETITLVGNVRLAQGKVNREAVVELFTQNEYNKRFLSDAGAQKEKVGSMGYRLYVPNDRATGIQILEKILKQFPIQSQGAPKLMRENPGQPLFQRPDYTDKFRRQNQEATPTVIRHGDRLLINRKAALTISQAWGGSGFFGAMLNADQVRRAVDYLDEQGDIELADALRAAARSGDGGVVLVRSGRILSGLKATLRHERGHLALLKLIADGSLLRGREAEFIDSNAARAAGRELTRLGYDPAQHAEEMFVDLIGGAVHRLGLTPDEGYELLKTLTKAIRHVHGPGAEKAISAIKKLVVTSLRGALDDNETVHDRNRGRTAVDRNESVRGPPDVREARSGVPRLVREEMPGSESARQRPSVTLGAGLGGLQPAWDVSADVLKKQIVPRVAKLLGNGAGFVRNAVDFFNPTYRVPTPTMDVISRMSGGRSAAEFIITSKLDRWGDRFRKMSKNEMVEFIDRVKGAVSAPLDQELQEAADFIRKVDDVLWRLITKYRPSLAYLEGHYRVIWKVIPGSAGKPGLKGIGRAPFQGSKGYMQQHTLDSMSEGIAQGGVPYSYNPLVMFAAHYADAMKYITAQRLWQQFGKMGVRKFVKTGRRAPDGFIKFDDPITNAYFPVPQGMVDAGKWWVEQSAANVLNNMLGRDYLRESYEDVPFSKISGPVGKFLVAVKNNTTALELAASPYHAVFEAIEAMGSMMGVGIREIANLGLGPLIGRMSGLKVGTGGPDAWAGMARGLKTVGMAPAAFITMAKHGGMARRVFTNYDEMRKTPDGRKWLAENPSATRDLPYYFIGGGKMGVPDDYQINAREGFRQYLADAKDTAASGDQRIVAATVAATKAIPAFNQWIMKPLFGTYIPNLKLSFFLKEFALAREEYAGRLASGEMTLDQIARRVVTSVENRFGEMNYDKMFWNRTFKTAAQINIRSVTWKLGNIGEAWNAISKQLQEGVRGAKKGEVPLLDMSLGWAFGVAVIAAVLGTIIHTAATHHGPKTFKDVLYPLIDEKTGLRVSIPGYARDYHHAWRDPKGYVKSSLSGWLGKFWDTLENKDFNRNPIYDETDPLYKQLFDMAKHQVPVPFGPGAAYKAIKEGRTKEGVANFFAFSKAPGYVDKSDAELLAQELAGHHREEGARTKVQADKAKAASDIIKAYRAGENPDEKIRAAREAGVIDNRDVVTYKKEAAKPQLASTMARLTMPEMLQVYDKATAEERDQVRRMVNDKVYSVKQNRPAEFGNPGSRTRQLSVKYFGTEPFVAKPAPLFGRPQPIL